MTISVGIAGASGYAGGELLRLLSGHPDFSVATASAASKAGQRISEVHPHLAHLGNRVFATAESKNFKDCDLVFIALPHGSSAKLVSELSPSVKIVDLGADFRLQSGAKWVEYYGSQSAHAGTWTYGLPELIDRTLIQESLRVANPGCYATAIALGAAPLFSSPLIDACDLVVVAASGTSGAGRSAAETLLASEIMGSMSSYKTGGVHQHTPEIEQTLSNFSKRPVTVSFTPLLAPMPRGIHATVSAKFEGSVPEIHDLYDDFYRNEFFIQVLPGTQQPKTSAVLGSNFVQIQALVDHHSKRVVVTVVLDNLVKGAAGQAIQNANLMFGLDEQSSLQGCGVAP